MTWHHPYTVVDTHCHAGLRKYEPIEALVDQMFRYGVDQAVLVQHQGEFDNRYLSECCQRFPGRFAVAALVDVTRPDAPDAVARAAELPGVRGLRIRCADPEPVWQKMNGLGMVATISGSGELLASAETRRRMEQYKNIKFCVEHLGSPDAREAAPYANYRAVLRLAELPHVYMKVSGYYGFTQEGYPYKAVIPFAQMALDAFGPRRLMWGSNFPPVSMREGYHNALAFPDLLFPDLSAEERAWLMGKTAQEVWSFRG